MSPTQSIQSWSTRSVPGAMRFDYWMSIMRTALWPVTEWDGISGDFSVDLQEAALGCISSMRESISAHQSHRTRSDVERSVERSYHVFIDLESSWGFACHAHCERVRPGDVVLMGEGVHETFVPSGFHGVILKCPVNWMHTWVSNPQLLIGRCIHADSRWGRVLSPMVSQLTPEFAAAPPLPAAVMVDQLGAVLALIAGEAEERAMPDLRKQILDRIRERCSEPQLSAADVAASLNIPPRILHRVLATRDLTFASQLLAMRIEVARQMLASRSFKQLTVAEIGRSAGFLSAAHFARVMRRRTGRTPLELRRPDL